jgi:hypothetical protein
LLKNYCALDLEKLGSDIVHEVVDRQSGIRVASTVTPTFFGNGARFDGPPDYGSLVAVLEAELEH